MTSVRKAFAVVAGAAAAILTPATAHADPTGHQVTYTVTSPNTLTATIQYMNSDPPSQAAYNADSSKFMNNVQAPISGGQPVVYTTTLANPNQWAIVTASGGCHWPDYDSSNVPQIQCQIAVDGQGGGTQSATTG